MYDNIFVGAGMCPVYLSVGDQEVLLDDSRRFADKAREAGVDVVLEIAAGQQHVYPVTVGSSAEATGAVDRVGAWLSKALDAGPRQGEVTAAAGHRGGRGGPSASSHAAIESRTGTVSTPP